MTKAELIRTMGDIAGRFDLSAEQAERIAELERREALLMAFVVGVDVMLNAEFAAEEREWWRWDYFEPSKQVASDLRAAIGWLPTEPVDGGAEEGR